MSHSKPSSTPFLFSVLLLLFLLPLPGLASPALEHVRLGEARFRISPENLNRQPLGADAFASADGFSLVEIVFNDAGFFGPGNMTLTIAGGTVADNGGVNAARCGTRGASSVAHSVPLGDGTHEVHSWYRAPDEFNRGSDSALTFRTITVHLSYDPDGPGAPVTTDVFIELSRPPSLFVHGLWSSEDTWSMDLVNDSRIPVRRRVDYSDSSADSFAQNVANQVVRNGVEAALSESDELLNRVAARVDLVGHSMGGLLGRIRTADADFPRPSACGSGSIRKIVTLDTPHEGSSLADLLTALTFLPSYGPEISALFAVLGKPIDQGAIFDLTVGSQPLSDLAAVPISSHAIVGTGGSDVLEFPLITLWTLVAFFDGSAPSEVFQAFQHDLIVPRPSQEGGLGTSAITAINGLDGLHFGIPGNTGSNLYGARIFELLDTPSSNSVWSNFPPGALAPSAGSPTVHRAAQALQAPSGASIGSSSLWPGAGRCPMALCPSKILGESGATARPASPRHFRDCRKSKGSPRETTVPLAPPAALRESCWWLLIPADRQKTMTLMRIPKPPFDGEHDNRTEVSRPRGPRRQRETRCHLLAECARVTRRSGTYLGG